MQTFEEFIDYLHRHADDDFQIRTIRVFHKWTKDKKWKARLRVGDMAILQMRGTMCVKEDNDALQGAN